MLSTGPLVASEFHLFSPAALPLTIPTMLLVGVSVLSGMAVLALNLASVFLPSFLQAILVALPTFLCDLSINLLHGLLQLVEQMPAASFQVAGPSSWWVGIWSRGLA